MYKVRLWLQFVSISPLPALVLFLWNSLLRHVINAIIHCYLCFQQSIVFKMNTKEEQKYFLLKHGFTIPVFFVDPHFHLASFFFSWRTFFNICYSVNLWWWIILAFSCLKKKIVHLLFWKKVFSLLNIELENNFFLSVV